MADELSRRDLLKSTGAFALVGAGLPAVVHGFSQRETRALSEVMTALSAYMSQAATHELPREAIEKTKHVILDTVAAMISGSELPPGKFAIQFARGYRGDKMATVAASNLLCGAMEAALANGMLAHSDETDDTHSFSQSHPGCSVVPASLAAGEQFGIEGVHFMRAVALG